ncbi:unnamed protein product [Paramecium sonneborni]|uniref:Uncharacterized protein n=1 Tax=Paramecium sonneborni TaxID=65129 RepID=A0A8S1L8H7_9CILI|nr:unnamed protein product [Paramecium sonneborni]
MASLPVPFYNPTQTQQPQLFGQLSTYQPIHSTVPIQCQPINTRLTSNVFSPVQPVVQQMIAPQPKLAQSYVTQPAIAQTIQQSVHPTIKGESRIEYIPYQKTITEYEEQEVVQYVPRERKVSDYYAIQYQTEYIPQVFQEKSIEYVPVERYQERVEYHTVERQVVQQQVMQQPIQIIQQQPVQVVQQQVSVVQQPVQVQAFQNVPATYAPQYPSPMISQQFLTTPQKIQQYVPPKANLNNII